MRILIVDDESSGREILVHLLSKLEDDLEIIGEASGVEEAEKKILDLQPDLVFLDVEMPTGTGFDLLAKVKDQDFEVVFTTAYDKYAIEAFRFSAIDYLLKPIEKSDLYAAVQKAKEQRNLKEQNGRVEHLLDSIRDANTRHDRIVLPTQDGFQIIRTEQVVFCQGDGAYTRFFLENKKQILVSKMLKEYDMVLSAHGFFRIHRSYLVNLTHVVRYFRGKGGEVEMSDGSVLAVSRDRKEEFLSKLM